MLSLLSLLLSLSLCHCHCHHCVIVVIVLCRRVAIVVVVVSESPSLSLLCHCHHRVVVAFKGVGKRQGMRDGQERQARDGARDEDARMRGCESARGWQVHPSCSFSRVTSSGTFVRIASR